MKELSISKTNFKMTVTYAIKIHWSRYNDVLQKSSLLEERYNDVPQAENALKTLKKSLNCCYKIVCIPMLSKTEKKNWRDYCHA